ncbi:MAG: carbonic anhydrase [Anaerolineae bacterium]|nr:carbonic anhydrase [Anaerolineae bacterium]
MSQVVDEVLAANVQYAQGFGKKSSLKSTPIRHIAILTCMDARLDPAKCAGLSEGDAHVIRNAGGRATDDVIRSLVISYKLLGTKEWFVIHHTDCGMCSITGDALSDLLNESLSPAEITPNGYRNTGSDPGSAEGYYIDWLTFKDESQCVVDDVTRIRHHPLVPHYITIYGYLYDVKTGRLLEVPAASEAGHPL